MKIVIAPDSFKESLSAPEVAAQIAAGFQEIFPEAEYRLLPLADGGEGTVAALVAASAGTSVQATVTGPLGEPVTACYGVTGDGRTAIVEMAAASGLALVPLARRNPLRTTSRGTGELLRLALDAGLRRILVGIGGSASNDCGAGLLQALGVRLLDARGREVGPGGGALDQVCTLDVSGLDPRLRECRIEVACDVDNPLTGPEGASAVFGPQKGASRAMVARLDANLAHFAALLKQALGQEVADRPGAGAAGGMGAALLALGASLRPGIEVVGELIGLDAALKDADLVITGEGRLDGQTLRGKAPVGVAGLAARHQVPVICLAGALGSDAHLVHAKGIDAVFGIVQRPCSLEEALAEAAPNLRCAARNVASSLRLGRVLERPSEGRFIPEDDR